MRALLVGEAPLRCPFDGITRKRLIRLIGAEAVGRLSLWGMSLDVAREREQFPQGVVVLLVGHRLAQAHGVRARYFQPCLLRNRVCYVVPSPDSTRWYSVEINRERAKRFFLALLLTLEGVKRPDGTLESREFKKRVSQAAREAGRVFA